MLVTNLENMCPPELEDYLAQVDEILEEEKKEEKDNAQHTLRK